MPGDPGPNKTAAMRIRELEKELEPAWCCNMGLVPVASPGMACLLFLLNIISPGLGTFLSMFFASKDPVPNTGQNPGA